MNVYVIEIADGYWYKLLMESEIINKIRWGYKVYSIEEFYNKKLRFYNNISISVFCGDGKKENTARVHLYKGLTLGEFKALIDDIEWADSASGAAWGHIALPNSVNDQVWIYLQINKRELMEEKAKEAENLKK